MKKPRHWGWITVGGIVALVVGFLVEEHLRGRWMLQRWKTAMAARGEKFRIDEVRPPDVPAKDNGHTELVSAAARVRGVWTDSELAPPVARFVAPARAIVSTRLSYWPATVRRPEKMRTNFTWAMWTAELAPFASVLADAREALAKPAFDARLAYEQGFTLPISHLASLKHLAVSLRNASILDLHAGRHREAVANLVAMLRVVESLKDERLLISQLVRIACASIAQTATWEALQTPGWSDEPLAQLQAGWEQLEFFGALARSLEMERAMAVDTFTQCRESPTLAGRMIDAVTPVGTSSPPPGAAPGSTLWDVMRNMPMPDGRGLYLRLWGFAWSHQDEFRFLRNQQRQQDEARRLEELGYGFATPEQVDEHVHVRTHLSAAPPLDQFRFPFSSMMGASDKSLDKSRTATVQRGLVIAAIALRRFEMRHGKPPAALTDLVPEFVGKIPIDPIDGQLLRYRPGTNGTFVLYSIGSDGRDDGGNPEPMSGEGSARNYNWNQARDMVWPMPATDDEVAAWREKEAR